MRLCADFTPLRKQIWFALIAGGGCLQITNHLMKRTVRHAKECYAETHEIWPPVQRYSGMSQYKPITTTEKNGMEYIFYGYTATFLQFSSITHE